MRQAKRDTSWKEIETEGKWQKHDTNRFYRKKREMITKRENIEIHKRENREKRDEKEKTQQKEIKEGTKMMKPKKINGGKTEEQRKKKQV